MKKGQGFEKKNIFFCGRYLSKGNMSMMVHASMRKAMVVKVIIEAPERKKKKKGLRTISVLWELYIHHNLICIMHESEVYRFCLRHAIDRDVECTTDKACGDFTKVVSFAVLFTLFTFGSVIPIDKVLK